MKGLAIMLLYSLQPGMVGVQSISGPRKMAELYWTRVYPSAQAEQLL